MSMLSNQADELRYVADKLEEHGTFVGYGGNVSCDTLMHDAAFMMREAACTIISLRDRLQESYEQVPEQGKRDDGGERESYGEVCDEIQAEHDEAVAAMNKAAGNWARADAVERLRENTREHSTESESMSESRWYELFGTPERAARTFADFCDACDKGECNDCPLDRLTDFCIGYDDLLEWMRGDA